MSERQALNDLYNNKPFINDKKQHVQGLLYYKNSILTDDYYLKNIYYYLEKEKIFTNTGVHQVFAYGDIKAGDPITTCSIKGACMKSPESSMAFGKAVTDIKKNHQEHYSGVLGVVYVEFL